MKDLIVPVEALVMMVGILVGVAFITLFERKILGYIQLRKGPNKVGPLGIFQPFSDAIKLFLKGMVSLNSFNMMLYHICPIMSLCLMLLVFCSTPWAGQLLDFNYGVLFMFCILGMSVYPIFGAGWTSNSKYSILGSLRSIAQTISYEVAFSIIILIAILFTGTYDFNAFNQFFMSFTLFPSLIFMWVICILSELNRTPYDFAEGESELVSGFNVEYSSYTFALIFMAEYGFILFMSYITVLIFSNTHMLIVLLFWGLTASLILLLRGAYPRYRYDKLMYMAWKTLLPNTINLLIIAAALSLIFLKLF